MLPCDSVSNITVLDAISTSSILADVLPLPSPYFHVLMGDSGSKDSQVSCTVGHGQTPLFAVRESKIGLLSAQLLMEKVANMK